MLDKLQSLLLKEKLVIGIVEPITIKDVGTFSAKIDSGNSGYNVIHGENLIIKDDIITFITSDFRGVRKSITSKIIETVKINIGSSNIQNRPVIQLDIIFGGIEFKNVKFSISDRAENKEKVLISKSFISNDLDALIDVGRENISNDNINYKIVEEGKINTIAKNVLNVDKVFRKIGFDSEEKYRKYNAKPDDDVKKRKNREEKEDVKIEEKKESLSTNLLNELAKRLKRYVKNENRLKCFNDKGDIIKLLDWDGYFNKNIFPDYKENYFENDIYNFLSSGKKPEIIEQLDKKMESICNSINKLYSETKSSKDALKKYENIEWVRKNITFSYIKENDKKENTEEKFNNFIRALGNNLPKFKIDLNVKMKKDWYYINTFIENKKNFITDFDKKAEKISKNFDVEINNYYESQWDKLEEAMKKYEVQNKSIFESLYKNFLSQKYLESILKQTETIKANYYAESYDYARKKAMNNIKNERKNFSIIYCSFGNFKDADLNGNSVKEENKSFYNKAKNDIIKSAKIDVFNDYEEYLKGKINNKDYFEENGNFIDTLFTFSDFVYNEIGKKNEDYVGCLALINLETGNIIKSWESVYKGDKKIKKSEESSKK